MGADVQPRMQICIGPCRCLEISKFHASICLVTTDNCQGSIQPSTKGRARYSLGSGNTLTTLAWALETD